MVVSVTLAKLLGLIYVVPLTRLIHTEGFGIYSNAYSLYVILLTLSTAGFPTAMGKLVSERLALKNYVEVEYLYRATMRIVLILSTVLFFVMWFGAPLYSHLVAIKASSVAVSSVTLSIRALSFALLVVPLMSGLRGYLQGFQLLEPSAYSQALEQFVRVIAIVLGAYLVMHNGGSVSDGAAAATFGAFVGAVASLIMLIAAVVPLRKKNSLYAGQVRRLQRSKHKEILRNLWRVAFPMSLGALVVPISTQVDSLTVQNFMIFGGFSFKAATAAYGTMRQAMQLIQLPLAFAMAIGASIVPAIAESRVLRDQASINSRINGTIRSMFFMTYPVAATLLMLGRPLDQMLFASTSGAVIISSVSFMSIFSSLELISTYMLQGLDNMYRPVRNMFIGVFIKLILNILLIIPFHIIGAAIATTIGYLFSSTLNILAVKKYGNFHFSVWKLSWPFIAATIPLCGALAAGDWLGHKIMAPVSHSPSLVASSQVFFAILIGAIVYLAASIWMRAITASDFQRLPFIGNQMSRLALLLRPE
jgi:O-antigen/teichoic acid export membrane protein